MAASMAISGGIESKQAIEMKKLSMKYQRKMKWPEMKLASNEKYRKTWKQSMAKVIENNVNMKYHGEKINDSQKKQ